MKHPDYNSPVELKKFLDDNGMAMQKKFGQNFMVNPNARTKIVNLLDPKDNELVWEVGPGLGCMTEEIMSRGASVRAFEIDRGFIGFLHGFFEEQEKEDRFRIIEGDVMKTWKKEGENQKPTKLFGNLPYNIAATFVADTITEGLVFEKCVFTVQKEVALRMAAKPDTENYSGFSVLCQWGYDVRTDLVLAGGNFWPRPNVDSQAVVMTKKTVPYEVSSPQMFKKVVSTLFAARRKTIANNIKPLLNGRSADEVFEAAGVDKSKRAENLGIEDFIRISEVLAK